MPKIDASSYYTYKEAKKVVSELNLKNYRDWCKYVSPYKNVKNASGETKKIRKLPSERKDPKLPADPRAFYLKHEQEWLGWGDFLGTGSLSTSSKGYLSYQDAIRTVRGLKIRTQEEYRDLIVKHGVKHLPLSPHNYYTRRGENFSWKELLYPRYISLDEAREFMWCMAEVKTFKDWLEYCSSGSKPKFIPSGPDKHYDNWVSWPDFLSSGNSSRPKKQA